MQSSQRLAALRTTFKEVELVRFGVSLTLEQVEAAAEAASLAEMQAREEPVKVAFERDQELVAAKQVHCWHTCSLHYKAQTVILKSS